MKPILFNTEMVRAILDGRKTVTRRTMKGDALININVDVDGSVIGVYDMFEGTVMPASNYAPCRTGDILYVRETFCKYDTDHVVDGVKFAYKADATPFSEEIRQQLGYKWSPSLHMPKEAARIFLRVTDVRAERLQDISVDDAINEGAWGGGYPKLPMSLLWENHPNAQNNAAASFAHLWDTTVKPTELPLHGWDANPWVWVIEFERISKEDAINA